jgi:hypothetical protein
LVMQGGKVPMDEALGNCRGMGPPKWEREEGVGVQCCANADAAMIGSGKSDRPEAIGEVKDRDARGGAWERVEW